MRSDEVHSGSRGLQQAQAFEERARLLLYVSCVLSLVMLSLYS